MGYQSGNSSLSTYAAFEDTYRGSEEFVRGMLEAYLPLLEGCGPVIDVGCGRGELLDLLRAAGTEAIGIDIDPSALARCREKGLHVVDGEGLEVLTGMAEGSVGAVTSIEVIEHLDPDSIRLFFEAAHRVLRPGGVLIAETVNPHSPPALKAFWLDITHVRPLYPESMLMLAQQSSFDSARIMFPSSTGDFDTDLRVAGSYAVVAAKEK
jgi:SAM-dependent methyltransferase